METCQTQEPAGQGLPDADSLAALRSWGPVLARSRGPLPVSTQGGRRFLAGSYRCDIRRQLIAFAHGRHRPDLAAVFEHTPTTTGRHGRAHDQDAWIVARTTPQVTDDVALWFTQRTVGVLCSRHSYAHASDGTHSAPAPVVDPNQEARGDRRACHRSVLRRAPCLDRACPCLDHAHATGRYRAVGAASAAA
ncbi:hypothetical protein BHUM_01085 [Candidatus Burkholderia humilis]|nr:hypothetical protein BHUM_01085 [Candidatus Burkholderia humilis]